MSNMRDAIRDDIRDPWRKVCNRDGAAVFSKQVPDGELLVLVGYGDVGEERPQWHMSISHRIPNPIDPNGSPFPGRTPTWDEICEARYRFVPDHANMAMMLPAKRLYVNFHSTCMHLREIPVRYASQDLEVGL